MYINYLYVKRVFHENTPSTNERDDEDDMVMVAEKVYVYFDNTILGTGDGKGQQMGVCSSLFVH